MATPMVIHQSDIAAYVRCPQELKLDREGAVSTQNSRSAYGSVMHLAIGVLVRYRDLDKALASFEHYWHPYNIEAVCEPVPHEGWLARDSWGGMRQRGLATLRNLWSELEGDDAQRLALEYEFLVPLTVEPRSGARIYLAGTVDSLALRYRKRLLELHIEDWKTGKQKWGLRWNAQGTAYCWASEQRSFWTGHEGIHLRRYGDTETTFYETGGFGGGGIDQAEAMEEAPRRFMWVDVENARWRDGGYRDHQDYRRLKLAAQQLAQQEMADVWPLRLDGETCQYCAFRKSCGGVPVPDETYGDPWA